jgi:LysR family transcriptional regulator, nitrogen assimilation regulatory protein
VASSVRPSVFQTRAVNPPLRTKLCLAISSLRPATLTQQRTLELIGETLERINA